MTEDSVLTLLAVECFVQYGGVVPKEELTEIKWHDQGGKFGEMDTRRKKGLRRTP